MVGGDTGDDDTGGGDGEVGRPPSGPSPMTWTGDAGGRSEWSINWPAVVPVLILVVVVVILWRAFEGGDDDHDASDADTVATLATTAPSAAGTTTTTTVRTTTTVAVPTTSTPDRQVLIRAEMKPCRFGDNCLVASFTLDGFEQTEGQFTCIYPNSEREFSYRDGGKEDACITADQGDTITIVVDGVRSATVSEENLTGEA